jgi:hypothetical protein
VLTLNKDKEKRLMLWSRRLGVLAGVVCASGLALSGVASAQDSGRKLPDHVFAPYFEAYTTDSPAELSQASGAKYLTMAFIQAPAVGSCDVAWNGDLTTPISTSVYGKDIAAIRAGGGDIIPSFGGYAADNAGTEIADSCTDVAAIAQAYEKVITTYGVTRLDFDIEDNSLTKPDAIDRRNQAIKLVEDWAGRTHRTVQFEYTLPTTTTGLGATGIKVLESAAKHKAKIDVINIMTFDYYDGAPHQMADDTVSAAKGTIAQLRAIWPNKSSDKLWSELGITEMIGVDDFGPPEIFTLDDAKTVEKWAAKKGIAKLSFWALQRDNGGCPGAPASDSCSGVEQSTWQFSHIFAPFTSRH